MFYSYLSRHGKKLMEVSIQQLERKQDPQASELKEMDGSNNHWVTTEVSPVTNEHLKAVVFVETLEICKALS